MHFDGEIKLEAGYWVQQFMQVLDPEVPILMCMHMHEGFRLQEGNSSVSNVHACLTGQQHEKRIGPHHGYKHTVID